MHPYRILIAGLGGVGGYIGGRLAAHYAPGHPEVEVRFLVRGANEAAIRAHGLLVEAAAEPNLLARPTHLSADPAALGVADLVILCTKGYDLEATLAQLQPSLGPATVLLPLLNGVDSAARTAHQLPGQPVWDGCVYIVARLAAPGRVRVTGAGRTLLFGAPAGPSPAMQSVEALLQAAGLDARLVPDIRRAVWEKFTFISPVATLTSAFDAPLGVVLAGTESRPLVDALLAEVQQLAAGLGIALPPEVGDRALSRMETLPYDTTSSMHSDYQAGKPTEVESLTGYVVRASHALGLACPAYERLYARLLRRS